eukprot:c20745_g3_i1.p1 GENE.c20745_g3_i1~~c20745_g3_i1.p1  ORF type:complete len:234 (-),score=63.79 c20745_g3_i1:22-723(-)
MQVETKNSSPPIVTTLLAIFIVIFSIIGYILPDVHVKFAMIPGSTLSGGFYFWNVLTGGYYEPNILGAILSSFGLLVGGFVLERAWGSMAFLRFIVIVNAVSCLLTFFLVMGCFMITHDQSFLLAHVAGFKGVIGALTIAVKQLYLDSPKRIIIHPKFLFTLSTQHLPGAYLLTSFIEECIIERNSEEFPLTICGLWVGWVYLRFYQKLNNSLPPGDNRENFSFHNQFATPLK